MRQGPPAGEASGCGAQDGAPQPDESLTPDYGDRGILVNLEGIRKTFGQTCVLDVESLTLLRGRVYGLLGANGSGKSTLVKIISGSLTPDSGATGQIDGNAVRWPVRAAAQGIAVVPQESSLCPELSVVDNLLVTRRRHDPLLGRLSWKEERLAAGRALARVGLHCNVRRMVGTLTPGEAALLCIARAVDELEESRVLARLLVLDEPTTALSAEEASRIFDVARSFADSGGAVVIVNHRLGEVRMSSDDVYVLRDGRVAARGSIDELDDTALIEAMFGGRILDHRNAERAEEDVLRTAGRGDSVATPLLRVWKNAAGGREEILAVHRNRVVGVTGLVGMDHDRLPYQLVGSAAGPDLEVEVDGRLVARNPRAMRDAGVRLLPADRAAHVFWLGGTVCENYTVAELGKHSRGPMLIRRSLRRATADMTRDYDVRGPGMDAPIGVLSGGNQQKVSIARAIAGGQWRILLAHEPTEGIDVATRRTILEQLRDLASEGRAVVILGADYEALANICDYIYVFTPHGEIQVLAGQAISEASIARTAMATLTGTEAAE